MPPDATERTFPRITEEGLDALRQRIGVKIGVTAEPWCHEATRDNIRHYAHGIGDDNPLWCVPEYAAGTKFGDVIALPAVHGDRQTVELAQRRVDIHADGGETLFSQVPGLFKLSGHAQSSLVSRFC